MNRLFLTDIKPLTGSNEKFVKRLSSERKQKMLKFRQEEDRLRCLAAGLLLDYRFGAEARTIREDRFGRPFLDGGPSFSIAHSGDYVLLSVGDGQTGCDLEKRDRLEPDHIARKILTPNEFEFWKISSDRIRIFYRFWTLKESYLKMIGKGFSLSPVRFQFDLSENDSIQWTGDDELRKEETEVFFQIIEDLPDYTAAVCCRKDRPANHWDFVHF